MIKISRKHQKEDAEIRSITDQLASDMEKEFDVNHHWSGNVLKFSRTGIDGAIELKDGEVEVRLKKSFFVPLSDSFLKSKIEEKLDLLL